MKLGCFASAITEVVVEMTTVVVVADDVATNTVDGFCTITFVGSSVTLFGDSEPCARIIRVCDLLLRVITFRPSRINDGSEILFDAVSGGFFELSAFDIVGAVGEISLVTIVELRMRVFAKLDNG